MAERDVDVLVVGFGPVGATVTALLASGPDPWAGVPHGVRELATRFGVVVLRIDLPPGKADGEEVAIGDPGGELSAFLRRGRATRALIRPDRFVYGAWR